MGVRIRCKYCQIHLVVSESAMGTNAKCPGCNGEFEVGHCVRELPPHPNPHVACVLSAISPGLGFIYCGSVLYGFFWSFVHAFIITAPAIVPGAFGMAIVGLFMQLIFAILARDEAYKFYRSELPPVVPTFDIGDGSVKSRMQMMGQYFRMLIKKLFDGKGEAKN